MIDVESLHFTYPGASKEALHGLEFSVEKGEVFGFLGPSGAGKSTTQKILIGLSKGYSGSIRVFGADLEKQGRSYFERIGVGFEFPNVYTRLTARENLSFFAAMYSKTTADPMALLEEVGLADDADRRVAEFSKGMKMRLNLCRALINLPELLFLDEPTGGQDPTNSRRIRELVKARQQAGTTVFLTTHDMHVAAELCDRVAFIVDGQISLIDSPRALMLDHGQDTVRVEYDSSQNRQARDFALDGLGTNDDFIDLLRNQRIETIHTLEATLEDVFIDVTGRSLS